MSDTDGWRTIPDDALRTAEMWDALSVYCFCDPTGRDVTRIVRIDPESNTPAMCGMCGRAYRLAVQVREG